jgi:hypothetical protein
MYAALGRDALIYNHISYIKGFGGLVISLLASSTLDREFAPGRSRRIFRAKNSSACLPSEAN